MGSGDRWSRCREADGVLHWRPEAIYAVASM
jgi:hypothetical protein